jgi:tRNA G46 methylase TrmB
MPFMARLLETLKRGGTLRLATNLEFYADEAADFGVREWGLVLEDRRAFTSAAPIEGAPRTHFEKKYLEDGQTCHDLVFRRK